MKTRSRGAGGFALITTVIMIAFAGVAAMAIGAGFAAESRRVRVCGVESQLRQLLLAGTVRAGEDFNRPAPGTSGSPRETMELPKSLDRPASVRIIEEPDPTDANRRFADITATLGQSHARQRVTFELVKTQWIATDARLQ